MQGTFQRNKILVLSFIALAFGNVVQAQEETYKPSEHNSKSGKQQIAQNTSKNVKSIGGTDKVFWDKAAIIKKKSNSDKDVQALVSRYRVDGKKVYFNIQNDNNALNDVPVKGVWVYVIGSANGAETQIDYSREPRVVLDVPADSETIWTEKDGPGSIFRDAYDTIWVVINGNPIRLDEESMNDPEVKKLLKRAGITIKNGKVYKDGREIGRVSRNTTTRHPRNSDEASDYTRTDRSHEEFEEVGPGGRRNIYIDDGGNTGSSADIDAIFADGDEGSYSRTRTRTKVHSDGDEFDDTDNSDEFNDSDRSNRRSSIEKFFERYKDDSGLDDSSLSDLEIILNGGDVGDDSSLSDLSLYLKSGKHSLDELREKLRELFPNAKDSFIDALAELLYSKYNKSKKPSRRTTHTDRSEYYDEDGTGSDGLTAADRAFIQALGPDFANAFNSNISLDISINDARSALDDADLNLSDALKKKLAALILKIVGSGDNDAESIKEKLRKAGVTDEDQLNKLVRIILNLEGSDDSDSHNRRKKPRHSDTEDESDDTPSGPGRRTRTDIDVSVSGGDEIMGPVDFGDGVYKLQIRKADGTFEYLTITFEDGKAVVKDDTGKVLYRSADGSWNGSWIYVGPGKQSKKNSKPGRDRNNNNDDDSTSLTIRILTQAGLNPDEIEMIFPGSKKKAGDKWIGMYGQHGNGKAFFEEFAEPIPAGDTDAEDVADFLGSKKK